MTWQDIKAIVNIADDMIERDIDGELPKCCETEEGYYTEILNQYNEYKKSRGE